MAGRIPAPAYLKVLRGNPGKRAVPAEVEPDRGSQCPEPPEFLSAYATEEWHRTAPELHRLRMLTVADVMTFAACCQSFAHWRAAEEELAQSGGELVVEDRDGTPRSARQGCPQRQHRDDAPRLAVRPYARGQIAARGGRSLSVGPWLDSRGNSVINTWRG